MRIAVILVMSALVAQAAVHTCADCSYASVSATNALVAVVDGDTISIPAGRCEWSFTLTISKAITLAGAGEDDTVILSAVADGTSVITWNLVAGKASRMTALQITNGSSARTWGQEITVNGLNTDARSWRVDHCKFFRVTRGIFNINTVNGVCDHVTIIAPASGVTAWVGYVKGSSWDGSQGANLFGDGSYADADDFGGTNFFFFEDCTFTNEYTQHLTMLDSQAGGRYVFRHTSVGNGSLESHGLEASRERSGRAFEIYSNYFAGIDTQDIVTYFRGGVSLIYSNQVTGYGASPSLKLLANRSQEASCCQPFGGSDGRNAWDVNDGGGPFVSGTCSSAGSLTMTDSGKSWTTDQWRGYTLRRTSGVTISSMTRSGSTVTVDTSAAHGFTSNDFVSVFGAAQSAYNNMWGYTNADSTTPDARRLTIVDPDTFTFPIGYTPSSPATGTLLACRGGWFSEIVGNTATTLTFRDSAFAGAHRMTFTAGDTYEIMRVTHYMDMVGRAQGSALSGDTPSLPGGWNDQVTSANYEWDNVKVGGGDIDFAVTGYVITEGTHYYSDTAKPGYQAQAYPHYLVSGIPPSGGSGGFTAHGINLNLKQ